MNVTEPSHPAKLNRFRTAAGVFLIFVGGVLFLDRYLRTGWLPLLILPLVGLFLYLSGVRIHHLGLIISGSLVGSLGVGMMAAWGPAIRFNGLQPVSVSVAPHPVLTQIGLLTLFFGIGWLLITFTCAALVLLPTWWAMVPGGVLCGVGYAMLFTPARWSDFVLYISIGTGAPLLLWGLITQLIGLVIPGCLLLGAGPGVYFAWQSPLPGNGLTQTGIMLAWFALGWAMITVSGRRLSHKYIW